MSRSVKLPNDTYLDSSGIVHSQKKLSEILNEILDSSYSKDKGYVRFANGFQVAWNIVNASLGGTQWENLFYSDHVMGDWAVPFTATPIVFSSANVLQYWTCVGDITSKSAGKVRAFRPNATKLNGSVWIIGFGWWK